MKLFQFKTNKESKEKDSNVRREQNMTTLNAHTNKEKKELGIKYKRKMTCDFFRVINKTYTTIYCIESKTFKN